MKNPIKIKMDDLGVPLFSETLTWGKVISLYRFHDFTTDFNVPQAASQLFFPPKACKPGLLEDSMELKGIKRLKMIR